MCVIGFASGWPNKPIFHSTSFAGSFSFQLSVFLRHHQILFLCKTMNVLFWAVLFLGLKRELVVFLFPYTLKRKYSILDTQTFVSSNIKNNNKINHKRGIKTTAGTCSQGCRFQILKWKGWWRREMMMWSESIMWKKMKDFWRESHSLKQGSGFWPLEFSQKLE